MSKRLRYTVETLLVNALIVSSLYQLLVYLANRRFWRQTPAMPVEVPPSISVVMPLRGKTPDTLAQLHVLAVSGPTDRYDVILVVEGDSDPALPVAQTVARSYPGTVRVVIAGPPGNHVAKLNLLQAGIAAAQGDLVALVEPGAQPDAELWNAALAALADSGVGGVFCPPLVLEPEAHGLSAFQRGGEMFTALHVNHARTAVLPFAALNGRISALASGFMLIRRRALDDMGGVLHLLDDASEGDALGRALREIGCRIVAVPVPVRVEFAPETFNEAIAHLLRRFIIHRMYRPATFFAWPITNPLTVGLALGFITEHEGRWWGRRTWWIAVWLRMAIAYELDRLRFGRGFTWVAYAQLFMLDTFIAPALWARALYQRTFLWDGRLYTIQPGGKTRPVDRESGALQA